MTPVLDLRCAAGLQVDESAAVDEGEAGSPCSLRSMSFNLPPELEAGEPPEARGLARDEVRLMVSYRAEDRVLHAQFRDLPCYLNPGDVLVVNTSGTMPAAVPARRADGTGSSSTCLRAAGRAVDRGISHAGSARQPTILCRVAGRNAGSAGWRECRRTRPLRARFSRRRACAAAPVAGDLASASACIHLPGPLRISDPVSLREGRLAR